MTIKSNPCKLCSSTYHTAAFCPSKPRTPIKRTSIKRKVQKMHTAKKKKSPTRSQLVKKLDTVFSQYIRLFYADEFGNAACVTCGTVRPWKEQQNGHYESRGHLPTRWLVDNCHVQDVACNVFKKGNYTEYAIYMVNRYGAGKLEELKALANSGEKITTPWIKEQIEHYTTEVARLKLEKGLD